MLRLRLLSACFASAALVVSARAGLRTADVMNGEPVWTSKSSAYGELSIRAIYLESPTYLLDLVGKPSTKPRWAFAGGTEASVRELFQRAGLPADIQARVLDPAQRLQQEGALVLFPLVEDLISIKPEVRAVIYQELAK